MTDNQFKYTPTRSLSARGSTTRPTSTWVLPRSTSHTESFRNYPRTVDANGRDEEYELYGEESTHWHRSYGSTPTRSASLNNYEMHRHQPIYEDTEDYLEEELQIRNSARSNNLGVGHYGQQQPLFRSESDNSVHIRRASPFLDSASSNPFPASRAYGSVSNLSSHYEEARGAKPKPYPASIYNIEEPRRHILYETPSPSAFPPFTPSPTKTTHSRSGDERAPSFRTPDTRPVLIPQLTPALKEVNSIRVVRNDEEDTAVLSDYLQDASVQYQSTVERMQAKLKSLKGDIESLSPPLPPMPPLPEGRNLVQSAESTHSTKNSRLLFVVISLFVFLVAIIWYHAIQPSMYYDVLHPA